MTRRLPFHLSIAVAELASARHFYVDVLGARPGRATADWLDVLLWGHQLTLQLRPDEVLPRERQGKRHFGVILPWAEWQREAERLRAQHAPFVSEPELLLVGTPEEQAKLFLEDPSHNVIELKAYRDPSHVLGSD